MNNWLKSTIGVSLAGFIIILAANGAAFFEALQAGWLFLLKLGASAPLGLSSFLLALAMAVAAQPFLRKWLPQHVRCIESREFLIESIALAIGIGVMYGQLRTLNGLLLGILAGLLAPYLQKGIAMLVALSLRATVGDPHLPPPADQEPPGHV
jgi:hypothetical protein